MKTDESKTYKILILRAAAIIFYVNCQCYLADV